MTRSRLFALGLLAFGLVMAGNGSYGQILFTEDFEGLALGPFQNENLGSIPSLDNTKVWTKTPPEGWTLDDSFIPAGGVRDWSGWAFANAQAWAFVAGDQRRSEFTNAKGTVAIADSDEWDDLPHDPGVYECYMSTPAIPIAGLPANSLVLTFDSSWRPEGQQDVNIVVSFDGGEPVEILYWNSIEGDPYFHPDTNTNEFVTVAVPNPAGAQNMVLTFGYLYGQNNWFWAIDNIKITSGNTVVFEEDFEGLPLGPFLDENLPEGVQTIDPNKVWTKTPPPGWTIDDSFMPEGGVLDWRGWAFANVVAWSLVAQDQRRSEFTKAKGAAAIADSDEWDDMPHDDGPWEGYLSTPPISIANVPANSLVLTFDSSWRPEGQQEVNIVVSFDGGEPVEVLYWNSTEGDPHFHPDTSTNESVTVEINNPAGAQSMVITFGYLYGTNNWWWAIDNIILRSGDITGVPDWEIHE
ncbi:MAG TPA: hypothetical protein PLH79_13520 [bacterium]|nr:hypothetical protein [Candidatus Omnitrophota bacterium]HOL95364.1 hypothetical protein [bacterium]HPP02313.1 hypothetical protein [bacterium]HXK94642.1 hypothetical protein [bacterium]